MIRSLYDGISGLRAQQVGMDVTANNIANVNTVGFKAGRATFKEAMAQLLKGPSRPPGAAGGTNPMQIGLGTSVGSIDTILTQGNMQSTGQITDLALEGTSYFAYSSGQGTFYSRNGALQYDSTGRLVCPTNGYTLQGMTAAADGTYPAGSKIGDIKIPFGQKAPANATTEVTYGCNLDSDSEGLGSIDYTNRFLADNTTGTLGAQTLTSLYDSSGNALGIMAGDTLTVRGYDAAGNEYTQNLIVQPTSTLSDLVTAIQGVTNNIDPAIPVTINADGSINVTTAGRAGPVNNLSVSSSRPGSNSYVSNAFTWGPTIATAVATGVDSNQIRRPAIATDNIATLYDASGTHIGGADPVTGNPYGLENGDVISINGAVGGKTKPTGTLTYSDGTNGVAATTMQDLLDAIQGTFNLPRSDGTPQNNLSVSMDSADSADDRMPDGSIVIRGQKELAFALQNMSISANNSNSNAITPARFNANLATVELQAARNTGQQSTSIVVYDESGDAHTLTTTFTNSGTPNEWLWQITTNAGETVLGGNTGKITFGQDGSPSSFTFDDGSTRFRFDPMNGSNEVDVNLNVGSPGSFLGITQFRSASTTAARSQDGYPMGKLQEISIDEYGEIKGLYTNGVSKSIAKIYVADFNNPAGLLKTNDSMFAVSNNSGEAVMQQPGVGTPTKIKPGALEMSNVELATEFTNMITTERAYQASARVITMSDTLLNELVQLVR
jgi:flagellar hook protein FlgE